jgi:hypothetical protein
MIITISDMWKNQQKMLDNDNQIKLSSLIVFLDLQYNNTARNLGDNKPKNTNIHKASGRLDPKKQNETNLEFFFQWQRF